MTGLSFARWLRTVRHLAPRQIYWRLRYTWERSGNLRRGTDGARWAWPSSDRDPGVVESFPQLLAPRLSVEPSGDLLAGLDEGRLVLLNQERELGSPEADWRLGPRSRDRLWIITLHYHEWLYALAVLAREDPDPGRRRRAGRHFRHWLQDWIRSCPLERPGSTALAWNSYAIATRIGWWIRAYRLAGDALLSGEPGLTGLFLRSLWQQAAFLSDHLEWDLGANHLIRDLAGLALAGRFFDDPEARIWSQRAARHAVEQSARQILRDGGHYERSAKYHLDVMDDVLQIVVVGRDEVARDALGARWCAMADWLQTMRHPTGESVHFNDGAILSAREIDGALEDGEGRLGAGLELSPTLGARYLSGTGHFAWRGPVWSVFFDVGEIGPDEQPGHAHADTLSLEVSVAGLRLVVDPGCYGYDDDDRRRYDRSTSAHSTVTVDRQDSSELWHVFRAGRRAHPRDLRLEIDDSLGGFVEAAHDGYEHLRGRPRHLRRLSVSPGKSLTVEDRVTGRGIHFLEGSLLLAPEWILEDVEDGWIARRDGAEVRIRLDGRRPIVPSRSRSPWHPDYGVETEAHRVGWHCETELPCEVRWRFEAVVGPDSSRGELP